MSGSGFQMQSDTLPILGSLNPHLPLLRALHINKIVVCSGPLRTAAGILRRSINKTKGKAWYALRMPARTLGLREFMLLYRSTFEDIFCHHRHYDTRGWHPGIRWGHSGLTVSDYHATLCGCWKRVLRRPVPVRETGRDPGKAS